MRSAWVELEEQSDQLIACTKKATTKVCPSNNQVHSRNQRGARRLEKHIVIFLSGEEEQEQEIKSRKAD